MVLELLRLQHSVSQYTFTTQAGDVAVAASDAVGDIEQAVCAVQLCMSCFARSSLRSWTSAAQSASATTIAAWSLVRSYVMQCNIARLLGRSCHTRLWVFCRRRHGAVLCGAPLQHQCHTSALVSGACQDMLSDEICLEQAYKHP